MYDNDPCIYKHGVLVQEGHKYTTSIYLTAGNVGAKNYAI